MYWKVKYHGQSCTFDSFRDAWITFRELLSEGLPKIYPVFMHRLDYERLEEFQGW